MNLNAGNFKLKLLSVFVLLGAFSAHAGRYCKPQEPDFGEFEGKIAPVQIKGRCVIPDASGITLADLKGLIQSTMKSDARILEAPRPVTEGGLRGERLVFEYLDNGDTDNVPGTYELVLVDDGSKIVKGRVRSLELRGAGLLGYLKSLNVSISGQLGSTAYINATIDSRVMKPAWAGTPKLFQKAVESFLPGLMERALRDIEADLDELR